MEIDIWKVLYNFPDLTYGEMLLILGYDVNWQIREAAEKRWKERF